MLTMLPTFNLVDICFCCSFDIIVVSAVVTLVFVINDDANDVVCKWRICWGSNTYVYVDSCVQALVQCCAKK